jgi:hypothetical protein
MKRLLFRMSALGTVVALGLIAIAQAQRSSDGGASPGPAASATSNRPVDTPTPVANPLRSPTPQPTTDFRGAEPAGIRPGMPGNEPMPTLATERFSLSAATDTGMAPPTVGAPPIAPDLGSPLPMAQPAQRGAIQPQMAGTAAIGSAPPAMQDFGPPAAGQGMNPAGANLQPTLAGAGAGPAMSMPAYEPPQAGTTTTPPLDTTRVAAQQMPELPTDSSFPPHQLNAPDAQPMNRASAPSTFANSPIQTNSHPVARASRNLRGFRHRNWLSRRSRRRRFK